MDIAVYTSKNQLATYFFFLNQIATCTFYMVFEFLYKKSI